MNANQEQPKSVFENAKTLMGWMTFITQTLATSVQPFLHRRFGSRYFGFQALAVFFLVPLYGLLWEGQDLRPLFYYLGAFAVMCATARIGVLTRTMRNDPEHSYYTGTPRLMRVFRRTPEITVKRCLEPLLVFLTGIALLSYSLPLGTYLMIAAFGLNASVNLTLNYERWRVQEMYDNYVEQRQFAERFREMRGDMS